MRRFSLSNLRPSNSRPANLCREIFSGARSLEPRRPLRGFGISFPKLAAEKEIFQAELLPVWRPERSWKKVLKDPTRLGGEAIPLPTRPLRILNPPENLRRLGRYLFWDKSRYTIREFSQIERLSGEWWEDDGGFTRTYYRVQVEEVGGELRSFWIFREQTSEAGTGGLFIHGVY
jgi:hypothetical protein